MGGVTEAVREGWRSFIHDHLNQLRQRLLQHPSVRAERRRLIDQFDSKHQKAHALIVRAFEAKEAERVASEEVVRCLTEAQNLLEIQGYGRRYPKDLLGDYNFKRDREVDAELDRYIAVVPALADDYAVYDDVRSNLDLMILIAHTPTKLQEAMVALCQKLGISLPSF